MQALDSRLFKDTKRLYILSAATESDIGKDGVWTCQRTLTVFFGS